MRRKLYTGLLAGILFIFTPSPVTALDLEFHGKALMGVLSSSNSFLLGGGDADSATIALGKVRFRAEAGTDDGQSKLVYGFETGANNFGGEEWDYSGDSEDFENRFAYIQSVLPGIDKNIYARAGLQLTGINHWLWTETAAGITLHGTGPVNWQTGWFRGLESGFDTTSNLDETDLFVIKGDFQPSSGINIGGFGVYALDFGGKRIIQEEDENYDVYNGIDNGADQYWLGITCEVDGPVFAVGDLIYQGGDAGPGGDLDVSAYLANLTVGALLSERTKVSVNALYVSGDDDNADGDLDAFQSIDADVKVGQIFFKDSLSASLDRFVDDQFGFGQPEGLENNGLLNLALEGEIQLDPRNNLRAAARYLATAEEDPTFDEDELGYEIDLWYTYKMNENLTLVLEGAYLFSGDLAEEIFEDDDDVYQVAAGAIFAF